MKLSSLWSQKSKAETAAAAAPSLKQTITNVEKVPSVQEWLPIEDVSRFVTRKDGHILSYIWLDPVNIGLMSDNEIELMIQRCFEVYNGLDFHWQFFSLPRPVDLDGYIVGLETQKMNQSNLKKRRVLENTIQQAASMATSGEAMEREFYIILWQAPSKNIANDEKVLSRFSHELANNLSARNVQARICDEQECRNLLFVFLNPLQAAYERAPSSSGPYIQGVYVKGGA